ncbi:MAG: hydroxymethylbilane synthase [Elusimicrobiota bacterium]
MSRLRLGTRGSALARAQSRWVADRLREAHPGLDVELVVISTSGDRFSEAMNAPVPPGRGPRAAEAEPPAPDGSPNVKAMFVKEIESALLDGGVDLGVHSAKDLPAELPEGLVVSAYPWREDPRDVFIGGPACRTWRRLPAGSVIGTASLRRRIQLGQSRPDVTFETVRGNVDTRLRKLEAGGVSGLVLALAGLRRLGREAVPHEVLSPDLLVPAPGQGALAIEARSDREDVREALRPLADERTRLEVELERAFLREAGGGCSTPLGALARVEDGEVLVRVFWSDPDGRNPARFSLRGGTRPEELAALVDGLRGRLEEERS